MSLLINHFYRFGEFTLDADQKVLLRDGKPLPLTPKVFDTLLILVQNSSQIVEREELMKQLWPNTYVEEANVTFNIKQLRKFLGDDARHPLYIETVARRGYRFIAAVEEVLNDSSSESRQTLRAAEISDVQSANSNHRFISQKKAQGSEPAVELATQKPLAMPEKRFAAQAAYAPASMSVGKRSVALVVVIAVVALAIFLWKFTNSSNKNVDEDSGIDGQFPALTPLKVEKLTETGQSRHAAISPDGRYIAYIRFEKKASIWLRQLATKTNVEIIPATDPPRIYGLAFANSGEYLYFVRGVPMALYRVSFLGGVPTKIVDQLEGNFAISADDSQIAFIRQTISQDGRREFALLVANADGTGERPLAVGAYPDRLNIPVWSPNGSSIICSYGNSLSGGQDVGIIEVRVADGAKKELSSEKFYYISKMAWLPDKSGLIVSARKALEGNNQLWRVSYPDVQIRQISEGIIDYLDLSIAAGADKAVATQASRISDIWVGSSREPRNLKKITQAIDRICWTPDGRIIYTSTASGNRDLWVMEPNGTRQRQLTAHAAVNDTPAVTPDNRYIVFRSNRTGVYQVWRMNLDGSNQIPLTNGGGKDFPAISPDGKWVLYNSTNDCHLWRVAIDGGESERLTEYPALFPAISPDGKMIACLERNEPKRNLSILILPFTGGKPQKRIAFAGGGFSGFRIQWTADGKALVYGIERNGPMAIMKQPLNGGPPQELLDFGEDELFDFGYSSNGESLAVTRGDWQHDIVLISDLNRR